jgi:uncharacterized protein
MVADDRDHERCAPLMEARSERRIVPSPVLVEVDHLVGRELGEAAVAAFIDTIVAGELEVADLTHGDYTRASELMRTYADLNVGLVDCAVLAVTERLAEPKLATLDHRHFGVMRPRHVEALELLPT